MEEEFYLIEESNDPNQILNKIKEKLGLKDNFKLLSKGFNYILFKSERYLLSISKVKEKLIIGRIVEVIIK